MSTLAVTLFAFFFATPWMALLAAAGAASIPIIIHLLHRNRYRVVTWAAMRFLLAAQRKNTRRMRLEQWILLAVRTLLVLLLVLAMAGVMPWAEELWSRFFPERAVLAAGQRRTHKIIVLDGSLSMAVKQGEGTFFDRARDQAVQIVRAGMGGDGFSVVLMAAPPRAIVSEPSDDARKVAEEIQALHVLHGNADVAGTLSTVEGMLGRSPGKFEEKEVYFLTDMQRSTWTARQALDPMLALQKIQAQARTIFVDVGRDGVNNLAVASLTLGAPLAATGSVTPITAVIHNYGSEARHGVRVDLLTGRARALPTDPLFKLSVSGQGVVDISPGQSAAVNFAHKFSMPGEYAVQVRLDSDALDLDDSRTVIIAVKDTVPVMLVNGKPAAEAFDRATEFLNFALNPFEKGLVPRNLPARTKVLSESQFADAGVGDLTGYDCVFLCDVARLSAAEIRRLENHLHSGGGVVICLGPRVDLEAYNRTLHKNGEGILPAKLLGWQRAPANRAFGFYADEEGYKRPPLEAFAGDSDKVSLMFARFRQYIRAEMPRAGRARKILAFMPDAPAAPVTKSVKEMMPVGDPALIEWQPTLAAAKDRSGRANVLARGPVILFTTTVNMDWTSWAVSPSFPAMMQEVLRMAIAGRLREQSALVGDAIEEYLPVGGAGLEVVMHVPDGRTDNTPMRDRDDVSVLSWTETFTSGIYRALIGRLPREHLFAVNVPTASDAQQACESDLTRTNREELRAAYPGWDVQIVSDPNDVIHAGGVSGGVTTRPQGGMGTVVARWCLMLMLGLLLVEVVLAFVFGHHSAALGTSAPPRGKSDRVIVALGAGLTPLMLAAALVLLHAAWTGDFLSFAPDDWRRSVEGWLGIPAPAAGEGSRWRLEFTPYLWSAAADPWLAALLAVGAGVMVIAVYRREGQTARIGYKLLLAGLRLSFLFLTLAVLLPQLRLWFERQGWPDIAIIIDDSRSMSAADRYQDPQVREAVDQLQHLGGLTAPERLQLAQTLLTRGQPDWLTMMLTQHKLKVHVYHCSGRAARVGDIVDGAEAGSHAQLVKAIQDLRADGESSQLGTAVRQVLNDFRGASLTAVVMLTDGVTTEGEDLLKAARYARQVGVPLFFVGIGDSRETRDLQLHDLQVEDTVYVNDRVVFEGRLTAQGYTDLTVPVLLREKGKDQVLDRQMVKIDANGKPVRFRLVHQPTEPGEKTYVIDVPVQPDEMQSADNNRLERTIFVREAKLIKVLYIEGSARYEFRYIKHLLERESSEDKRNKTLDLKVLLVDSSEEYARQDKSALSEFPTRVELNQFDVVILGDADPRNPKLGEKHLSELADFVRERGGGLLMLAGEDFNPHAFRDTPLKDILPVEVTGPAPDDIDRVEGFRPELTAMGRFHPIFRFDPGEAKNAEIWNSLPELYWWSEAYRTKPAAEVLAAHPQATNEADGAGRTDGNARERHPLIVQQFVGAGRCLFFGLNETWRWRYREHELRFNQFWIQTVRYLARSRLGRIELRLDRQTPYRRGEPIKITVRFPDDTPPPSAETEVKVFIERTLPRETGGTEGQTIALAKVEGSRAAYEALLTRTPEGEYRFWLSAPAVTGSKPRAECRVLVPPGEMDRLRMNREDMERAALETQGRFFTLAEADQMLDELPAGTRVALNAPQPPRLLWNQPLVFGLALVLLSSEWFLRKRKHLL